MTVARPERLIGVLGTHTEVGKTFVTSRWLVRLREQGLRVAARKPVQSYDANDAVTDAKQLAVATGEREFDVCPSHRRYPLALAPPMAADLLKQPSILLSSLADEIRWPRGIDVGVVETVGGPRSPLAHDGDSIDLIAMLQPDAILMVADAGLGMLNAVRLSMSCVQRIPVTVFLNHYDDANELHRLNRRWLRERYDIETEVDIRQLAGRCGVGI
jgi:dethiobiotin synthetase